MYVPSVVKYAAHRCCEQHVQRHPAVRGVPSFPGLVREPLVVRTHPSGPAVGLDQRSTASSTCFQPFLARVYAPIKNLCELPRRIRNLVGSLRQLALSAVHAAATRPVTLSATTRTAAASCPRHSRTAPLVRPGLTGSESVGWPLASARGASAQDPASGARTNINAMLYGQLLGLPGCLVPPGSPGRLILAPASLNAKH